MLKLTLKKKWFDVMVTGEKSSEYREMGKWIESRLFNKDGSIREYDFVKFTNGYGSTRPSFICRYGGFQISPYVEKKYSNNEVVEGGPFYEILLGDVIVRENIQN